MSRLFSGDLFIYKQVLDFLVSVHADDMYTVSGVSRSHAQRSRYFSRIKNSPSHPPFVGFQRLVRHAMASKLAPHGSSFVKPGTLSWTS